jgi:hypothetical protein
MNKGKWSQPGIPHRGWSCENVEDRGAPDAVCEMCESQNMRYVHYMSHPQFDGVLACGCDCAGRMEENYARAKARDSKMKSAASRKARFPNLRAWKISQKGNWTMKYHGAWVTIFPQGNGFKYDISRSGQEALFSPRVYPTDQDAKSAAFDALEFKEYN